MTPLLIALTILSVALIVGPLLVALPNVTQTPAMLLAAHAAGILAPAVSAALAVLLAIWLWRKRTWGAASLLVIAVACSVLSRINIMGWIFAPARGAQIIGIGGFHDVRETDMVIGVVIGRESRAYPVRYLAYHHMLNDQLGSTALLPTY